MAQKQRIEEENRRMKEWEKKFDEEQRLKEEEVVKKFYSNEDSKVESDQSLNFQKNENDESDIKN